MNWKILLFSMFLTSSLAFAMDHDWNVGEKVDMMKNDLQLTDEQVKAVQPVIEDYKNSMDQAAKQKEDRLNGILTADQRKKMMDKKNEMKKHMKDMNSMHKEMKDHAEDEMRKETQN